MASTKKQSGSQIIRALETVWTEIRKRHADVPDVVIITGAGLTGGNSKWAHFWRERWTDKGDQTQRPEMFVAGERMGMGARLVLQSMLHEAAHAVAYVRDIKDTSRDNRYHNGNFRTVASELGLIYSDDRPDEKIGYSGVELKPETEDAYASVIQKLDAAIKIYLDDPLMKALTGITTGGNRIPRGIGRTGTTTVSRNNVKYECDCRKPRVMRMAPSVFEQASVICGTCGQDFHESK